MAQVPPPDDGEHDDDDFELSPAYRIMRILVIVGIAAGIVSAGIIIYDAYRANRAALEAQAGHLAGPGPTDEPPPAPVAATNGARSRRKAPDQGMEDVADLAEGQ